MKFNATTSSASLDSLLTGKTSYDNAKQKGVDAVEIKNNGSATIYFECYDDATTADGYPLEAGKSRVFIGDTLSDIYVIAGSTVECRAFIGRY